MYITSVSHHTVGQVICVLYFSKMELAVFYCLNFFILAITAASVGKLNGVSGSVKIIEFDLNSDAFIVSKLDFAERLSKLDSQNQVVFTKDFTSIVYLKFSSKNDVYIFEQVDLFTRNVWVLNSDSIDITNQFNYSASSDLPAFFDHEDNLFLDTTSGIGILRNDAIAPVLIPRLEGFHLKTDDTYDLDTAGNVYLGLVQDLVSVDKSVMLDKAQKTRPDPMPYFFNLRRFGKIHAQKILDGSLYLCLDYSIIKYRNDDVTVIYPRNESGPCDFYVTNNRIFVKYLVGDFFCYVGEIKADDTFVPSTGAGWGSLEKSCNIHQTSDRYGTVFFGYSDYGSIVYYEKINDGNKQINMPNSLFIFGLTTSDHGSLWILSQDLYLVPFGQTEALKISGLPYVAKPWPFKAKPGTNDVFIGSHDGVYIGTV